MENPEFVSGKYNTHFIENNKKVLFAKQDQDELHMDIAAMVAFFDYHSTYKKQEICTKKCLEMNEWKAYGRSAGMNRL